MIGWADWINPVGFVGGGGSSPVDPAFNITNAGETVTHNGSAVTHTPDIDPALMVMNSGSIVTHIGQIVTNGA